MLYAVKQARPLIILVGVVLFVLAACRAVGWLPFGDVTGLALFGFACWLASTF